MADGAHAGRRSQGQPARGRRHAPFLDVLAAVPGLWLALFFLAPLLVTVSASFHVAAFGGLGQALTLDNYAQLLSGTYLRTFLRTVGLAVLAGAITVMVAMPIALGIARSSGRARTVLLGLILVPYFSSFLIRVLAWQVILSPPGLLGTKTAVVIGMVYGYLPIAVIPLVLVFRAIPASVLDAASDLGAGSVRRFLTVTLPLARPGIATAGMLTGVPMLGELVIPQILGAGRGLFLGQLVQVNYLQSQNYAFGSAVAVGIMAAVAVLIAVLLRFTRGFQQEGLQ